MQLIEMMEANAGWCTECQEFTSDCCEPDARNYKCPECGNRTVFGAEEAIIEGLIDDDRLEDFDDLDRL